MVSIYIQYSLQALNPYLPHGIERLGRYARRRPNLLLYAVLHLSSKVSFRMSQNKKNQSGMSAEERKASLSLAAIFCLRMMGLFLILPVFALYAEQLEGVTPLLIGAAIGAYGLTQAALQIPLGMLSDRIGRRPV